MLQAARAKPKGTGGSWGLLRLILRLYLCDVRSRVIV